MTTPCAYVSKRPPYKKGPDPPVHLEYFSGKANPLLQIVLSSLIPLFFLQQFRAATLQRQAASRFVPWFMDCPNVLVTKGTTSTKMEKLAMVGQT